MRLSGSWLDDAASQRFLMAMETEGHAAYFVGGCVRNAVMRVPVQDVDIATSATPQIVSKIAEELGFRVIPTGLSHGTVTICSRPTTLEVTTFRRDIAADGRRATIAYSTNIEDDARRRDFTMNAIYADRFGKVIDPIDGLSDAIKRRVRFVGDPDRRISEDFLRILRFFRFFAIYGDPTIGIDPEGLAACATNLAGIETLSKERVGSEMRKLLGAPDPVQAVASMAQAGVLARVLPGADPRWLGLLHHVEAGIEPDWLRRLAAIGGVDPRNNLRLSREEAQALDEILGNIGSTHSPAALGWVVGEARAQDVVLLRAAMLEAPPPREWLREIRRGSKAQMPVNADDLMPSLTGKALGKRLRAIEKRWLHSDLRLEKAQLLA